MYPQKKELAVLEVKVGPITKNYRRPTCKINGNDNKRFVGWKAEVTHVTPNGEFKETHDRRRKEDVLQVTGFLKTSAVAGILTISLWDGTYRGGYTTHHSDVHGTIPRPHGLPTTAIEL